MDDDNRVHDVTYVVWEFSKGGWHQKRVSSRSDSEAFLGLVCLRCKYLRGCSKCDYVGCSFGRALRYKPCGNFSSVGSV